MLPYIAYMDPMGQSIHVQSIFCDLSKISNVNLSQSCQANVINFDRKLHERNNP